MQVATVHAGLLIRRSNHRNDKRQVEFVCCSSFFVGRVLDQKLSFKALFLASFVALMHWFIKRSKR